MCGGDVDCILDQAWNALEAEMERRAMERFGVGRVKYTRLCGVLVPVVRELYSVPVHDGFVEWKVYQPMDVYVIDLSQVPDERTLWCILEEIKDREGRVD